MKWNELDETSSADKVDSEQEEEEIVRKVNKETVLALALASCTLWIVLAVGITVAWSTAESRVFGLAILPTAIVAGLLVVSLRLASEAASSSPG